MLANQGKGGEASYQKQKGNSGLGYVAKLWLE